MTLIKREMFDGGSVTNTGSLTSAAPGGFDAVTNEIQRISVGAKTNGVAGEGWSGRVDRSVTWGRFNLPTPSIQDGFACGWFRFSSFAVDGADVPQNAETTFLSLQNAVNTMELAMKVKGDGTLTLSATGMADRTNAVLLTKNVWYFLGMRYWRQQYGNRTNEFYYATQGDVSSNLLNLIHSTNTTTGNSQLSSYWLAGGSSAGGTWGQRWAGRMSGMCVYTNAYAEALAYPADLVMPPTNAATWYVNPATGSDLNDGRATNQAWAGANRLVQAMYNGEVAGSATPWMTATGAVTSAMSDTNFVAGITAGTISVGGDRVLIDTSATNLFTTNQLTFKKPGIELASANSDYATITPLVILTNGWTNYGGSFTNVWVTPQTDGTNGLVWEDGKWLMCWTNASAALVLTNLNDTPGSYCNDANLIYLHPLGDTDPRSDGKVYTRAGKLFPEGTAPNVVSTCYLLGAGDVRLTRLKILGSPVRNMTTGVMIATAALQNAATNRVVIDGCWFGYGGTHSYAGVRDAGDNFLIYITNTVMYGGAPFDATVQSAGFTPGVEHTTGTNGTNANRRVWYENCDWSNDSLLYSAIGTSTNGGQWITHDSGQNARQFNYVKFVRCRGNVASLNPTIVDYGWTLDDCWMRFAKVWSSKVVMNRCTVDSYVSGYLGSLIEHSLFNFHYFDATNLTPVSGHFVFRHCTFDGRNVTHNSALLPYLQTSVTNEYFSFSNNVFLTISNRPPFQFAAGQTNFMQNNVYELGPSNFVMRSAADTSKLTNFVDWQSLGFDAGSVAGDARVDIFARPLFDSPARRLNLDTGPAQDLTSRWFQSRHTAGALEYAGVSGFWGWPAQTARLTPDASRAETPQYAPAGPVVETLPADITILTLETMDQIYWWTNSGPTNVINGTVSVNEGVTLHSYSTLAGSLNSYVHSVTFTTNAP